MSSAKNFNVKNGLSVNNQEIVDSSGNVKVPGSLTVEADVTLAGVGQLNLPSGTTLQRTSEVGGALRFNEDTLTVEAYATKWFDIAPSVRFMRFIFSTPSLEWRAVHGLNSSIIQSTMRDVSGRTLYADVVAENLNTVVCSLTEAVAGTLDLLIDISESDSIVV